MVSTTRSALIAAFLTAAIMTGPATRAQVTPPSISSAAAASAPTEETLQLAEQLAGILFDNPTTSQSADQLMASIAQPFAAIDPSWQPLLQETAQEEFKDDKGLMTRSLAQGIAPHFTAAELRAGLAFFKGPAGVAIFQQVKDDAAVNAIKQARATLLSTEEGKSFARKFQDIGSWTAEPEKRFWAAFTLRLFDRFGRTVQEQPQPAQTPPSGAEEAGSVLASRIYTREALAPFVRGAATAEISPHAQELHPKWAGYLGTAVDLELDAHYSDVCRVFGRYIAKSMTAAEVRQALVFFNTPAGYVAQGVLAGYLEGKPPPRVPTGTDRKISAFLATSAGRKLTAALSEAKGPDSDYAAAEKEFARLIMPGAMQRFAKMALADEPAF